VSIDEQIKYWIDSAEHDLTVAEHLFGCGDYSWSLFLGHLVLEKMFKAIYVRDRREIPPRSHNLLTLAKSTSLSLAQDQEEFLFKVNSFNIEARYPDPKQQFYKLCTREFALENLTKIKEFYQWLKCRIE
jgi:HEPN domain-containing protein